ncbi:MAG: hypothetical protein AYK19_14215 [Theionarchaea archaeon DG-70-1]|nr:MAG: hypothetical protein AYK19_14215 [Theionarchaea archaeon DG-70-1]
MYEIEKTQFSEVHPLLRGVSTYLSLSAIVKGKSSGRIWVDDPSDPGTALVYDLVNGFLFVLGRPDCIDSSKINYFLKDELLPLVKKSKKYTKIFVIILSDITESQSNELVEGLSFNIGSIHHFYLNSRKNIAELTVAIPNPFHLVKIDGEILDNVKIANIKEVKRCIKACWRNLEDYVKEGIGYALLAGDTVVSWCSTDYVVSSTCELYAETFDSYKQKGLGTMVTLACVKECLNHNYEVNWHCWHGNTGSIRIAEKIGFSQKGIQRVQVITL